MLNHTVLLYNSYTSSSFLQNKSLLLCSFALCNFPHFSSLSAFMPNSSVTTALCDQTLQAINSRMRSIKRISQYSTPSTRLHLLLFAPVNRSALNVYDVEGSIKRAHQRENWTCRAQGFVS